MTTQVVVVGSGYAGAGAVKAFEDEVGAGEAELTWVSEHDYHLVLHEVHRVIRNPAVESKLTIPVDEIMSDRSTFVEGRVVNVDTDERAAAASLRAIADGRTSVVGRRTPWRVSLRQFAGGAKRRALRTIADLR